MGCMNTRSYDQSKMNPKTVSKSQMHSNTFNMMSEVKIEGLEESEHRYSLLGKEDNPE